jgi:formylglycine-generating enzyme required for sulfatase activity
MRNFRPRNLMMNRLLVLAALLFGFPAHAEVTIDWVIVGEPGNADDPDTGSFWGSVAVTYRISKYEVTNGQYAEFLNAVAASDTYSLYNTNMANPVPVWKGTGGITRSGSSGSYTYSAIPGRENLPVNWVSFYDALRFANWLHNGQPTGAQDSTTTEDGAYTMITEIYPLTVITRNVEAKIFLPTEDEWYKAAYYAGSGIYYGYPAGSDTQTTCAVPGSTPNTANCYLVVGDLTDVGSYTGSPSPNGTFDQGGNLSEWNESIAVSEYRVVRGGDFYEYAGTISALIAYIDYPWSEGPLTGFRVAASAPGVPALSPIGLLLVAAGLLGFGAYRRGRA